MSEKAAAVCPELKEYPPWLEITKAGVNSFLPPNSFI